MWKHYLIGALISVAAGWFFLRTIPLDHMGQALAEMNPLYLLPCAAIYLASYAVRAIRWHFLMSPLAKVRFMPLFSALMIGFLGNNILPAHLGEVVRAYVLGKSEGVSKSGTFATVVMERVYDGLTVLLFLFVVLIFMDLPSGEVKGSLITVQGLRAAGWLGLGLFAGMLAVFQVFFYKREFALKCCGFCLRPFPSGPREKIIGILDSFTAGLAVASPWDLLWVIGSSIGVWLLLGLWAWSLMPAFGLKLGPMAGILMEVVIALALLIPSAPAFLGTFHLAAAATLGFMGADGAVAGSYAMVLWLVHFVITTIIGLIMLWRQGLGLKDLGRVKREDGAQDTCDLQ